MCKSLPVTNPVLMAPINLLTRRGINVISSRLGNRGRPIIEVSRPFLAWKDKSVEITEMQNGNIRRVVNMFIWRGCFIVWA